MRAFTQRAVAIISHIPEGRVMTYGQIAALAGSPRGARQIVRILHSMSKKYKLPWHRVINGKGKIGMQDDVSFNLQKMHLAAEGVQVSEEGAIDLVRFQYVPARLPELRFEDWEME
ncbi:MGMT family protein [Brevibacillus choshinensis]|uniref:MGMT family protein n=1 Tax=Brevibacillus choshinensis TaxID=54911 RepID=UPI002E1DEA36|nr:MGMT family protein [Brevibacillus choshinensis]MED4581224.1 MGMT family protein [Brevibacillus choshinensis]MED4750881.1 MGMT family protein [Brevibacillus choshinensis]MED4783009.1 MGMT family protein [Brevibacillus choshinensis]